MKRYIPTLMLLGLMFVGYRMISSGTMSPILMLGLTAVMFLVFLSAKPKDKGSAITPAEIEEALGEFAKDTFTDDSQESKDFQAALANFQGSMPKAALAKLNKLAPQCRNNQERYAVAMIRAIIYRKLNEYEKAVAEYNQAVVLNPTTEVAFNIGSCQQRLGLLRKARDSYEFALELDPRNIQAISAIATTWVADRNYDNALSYAQMVLDVEENNASALATCAICHSLLNHPQRAADFTEKAVREGYDRKKIEETINALRK